jgi:hypothetical protein
MMRGMMRSPLFWILLAAAGLRLFGLFWGLPAADGWDDDGFAPRNFLTALALTWKPGAFFTYPPLHAILLALPSLPVAGWALAHAPSLSQHDVIATITQPAYMTYFAVMARLVAIVLSLGIIGIIGEMARLIAGPRAGLLAAGAAALNFGLTYYGQVSNLDVPYLFWACLSLLFVMQAVTLQQPRRFWWAAFSAAAAMATKDQAYAIFLLSLPVFLALWFALDAWPRAHARTVLTRLALAAAAAIATLLLVDGAVTNPSGFLKRLAFLAGPASGDYAEYAPGPAGWWALSRDMAAYYLHGFGLTAVTLAVLGLMLAMRRRGTALAVALLPVLAAISFTICFNFAALRSDVRFLLPQAVLACVYIGITAEILVFAATPWLRWVGRIAVAVVALIALHQVTAIDAAMLLDPRYDAANWLAQKARAGDGIEVYDRNWLLPHFSQGVRVWRVGQGDVRLRNPLPGVIEVQQPFATLALRHPRFILVSAVWLRRYLPVAPPPQGRILSRNQQADLKDHDTRLYFAVLAQGQAGYRLVHIARYRGQYWPTVHLHDSLNEPLGIYERLP